jgi:RNA polymerase sigma-B factor
MLQEANRRERIDTDLLRRYHDEGDLQAREQLAERCVPLVRSIARKYVGRGEDFEDLQQAGMVGLVKAIDRFDVATGHRFISFAVPNIQGEIRRHFRDRTWAVHVPRSVQELDARVQSARRAMLEETGHEASVDDLAETLEVTAAEIRDAQAAGRSYRAASLDQPVGEGRTLTDARGTTDDGYAVVEDRSVTEEALEVLDDRERLVVTWRFRDELLQREIAERIGVSQMQVSRILKQAVERMHDRVAETGSGGLAA